MGQLALVRQHYSGYSAYRATNLGSRYSETDNNYDTSESSNENDSRESSNETANSESSNETANSESSNEPDIRESDISKSNKAYDIRRHPETTHHRRGAGAGARGAERWGNRRNCRRFNRRCGCLGWRYLWSAEVHWKDLRRVD
ncbi:unnamed protein product [Gadus morhua 'NCC']